MTPFTWASLAAALSVVLVAAGVRGRLFAIFVSVLMGVHTLISTALFPAFSWCWPLYVYLQVAVYAHFLLLARPRLRPIWYRMLISIPASFFVAGTFLALPWALVAAFGLAPLGAWLPYAVALVGVLQSSRFASEEIDITLDGAAVDSLRRHAHGDVRVSRPLSIVQITDPHLGPFMSEERLRRVCERAVARAPDLVLLTGDFVTMESHRAPDALARAFAPLAKLEGRVFACLGNHDHEAPATVVHAMQAAGALLLVDDATVVQTGAGPVQIVGMDYSMRDRKKKMDAVCARHPRQPGVLRMVLLHDPGAFRHLPEGDADIVLSGHTHGGQLGLLTFGLKHTFLSAFTSIPDHGLWARGPDRLYVHRGTGHYGFPLRVGVPAEDSLVRLHWHGWSAS